jgi:hypothetical protein
MLLSMEGAKAAGICCGRKICADAFLEIIGGGRRCGFAAHEVNVYGAHRAVVRVGSPPPVMEGLGGVEKVSLWIVAGSCCWGSSSGR